MNSIPRFSILLSAALLVIAPLARSQSAGPRIGYVYPAGGQQGTTFQVTVGGQSLDGVNGAIISGGGVEAAVVEFIKPLTQGQINNLRDELRELQDKRAAFIKSGKAARFTEAKEAWTPADEKRIAEIRQKFTLFLRTPATPAIGDTVTLKVTLAPDAAPGERELRLRTPNGLSNPLVFCIGQLPEFRKQRPEPKLGDGPPSFAQLRYRNPEQAVAPTQMSIRHPSIVNGQTLPGGVDRYSFYARRGQNLVVAVSARTLIPYLADAVPGWFQATVALYNSRGEEVAYEDDFRFHPDPVLCFRVPLDGEYVMEIRDSIYRGREDFVYRIAIGELPYLTNIFPLGGQTGTATRLELKGWNLPTTIMTRNNKQAGTFPFSIRKGEFVSNHVPFAVDTLPETLEQEPNDSPANAQAVSLPIIVNGRIGQPGESDVFKIQGRAGDEFVAEVLARRLGSPLDSVLKLTDSTGRQLAVNNDHDDKSAGLITHQADSYLRVTLSASGTYYLHLADMQRKGGAEYAYRLRLGPPRPDFELSVVPSSINARAGANVPVTVYAFRKDGFAGDIALALKDSNGFTLSGARVPGNQDQVRVTLTVPSTPRSEPFNLSLEGRASIEGTDVVRLAAPADDMMQAFAYRHLVPAQQLKVAVSGRSAQNSPAKIVGADPVRIPVGGTARVQIAAPAGSPKGGLHLELSDPPAGIAIQKVSPNSTGAEIVLQSDGSKSKAGLSGNLIVNVFADAGSGKQKGSQRRAPLGTLPAIPFEVVAR